MLFENEKARVTLNLSMRLVRRQKELCHQPQARERQKFKSSPS